MAVDVDTLQITIEAEAADAAGNVGSLVESLTQLQRLASGQFGGIVSSIKNLGKAAELALPKGVTDRQKALGNVAKVVTPKVDKSAEDAVHQLTTEEIAAEKAAKDLGKTDIKPEVDTKQLSIFDQEVQDMIKNANSAQVKVPTVETPKVELTNMETGSFADGLKPATDAVTLLSAALQNILNTVGEVGPIAGTFSSIIQGLSEVANGTAQVINELGNAVAPVKSSIEQMSGLLKEAETSANTVKGVVTEVAQSTKQISDAISNINSGVSISDTNSGTSTAETSACFRDLFKAASDAAIEVGKLKDAILEIPDVTLIDIASQINSVRDSAIDALDPVGKLSSALQTIKNTSGGLHKIRFTPSLPTSPEKVVTGTEQAAPTIELKSSVNGQKVIAESTESVSTLQNILDNLTQSTGSVSGEISALGQNLQSALGSSDFAPLVMQLAKAKTQIDLSDDALKRMADRLETIKSLQSYGSFKVPGLTDAEKRIEGFAKQSENAHAALDQMVQAVVDFSRGKIDIADLEQVIQAYKEIALYSKLAGSSTRSAMVDSSTYTKAFLALLKEYAGAYSNVQALDEQIAKATADLDVLRNKGTSRSFSGKGTGTAGDLAGSGIQEAELRLNALTEAADIARQKVFDLGDALTQIASGEIELTPEQLKTMTAYYKGLGADSKSFGKATKTSFSDASSAIKGAMGVLKDYQDASITVDKLKRSLDDLESRKAKADGATDVQNMVGGKLSAVADSISEFSAAQATAIQKANALRDAIDKVIRGEEQIPVSQLQALSEAYSEAERAARGLEGAAKASMSSLESDIKDARAALKSLQGSEIKVSGFSTQKADWQAQLTEMQGNTDIGNLAKTEIDAASAALKVFVDVEQTAADKVIALREAIKAIKMGTKDALPISQLKNLVVACEAAEKNAKTMGDRAKAAFSQASTAISDAAASINKLNSTKLTLEKQLQPAEVYAAGLDKSIVDMRRRLEVLKALDIESTNPTAFNSVSGNLQSFEAAADLVKAKIEEIRTTLQGLNDHPIDLNADDAEKQIEEMLANLSKLKQEYDELKSGADKAKIISDASLKNALSDSSSYTQGISVLEKQLQSAEVYAAKLDRSLADMRRKLEALRVSGVASSNPDAFNSAAKNLQSFEAAADQVKAKIEEIRSTLQDLKDHPIDLKADDAKKQIEEMLANLSKLKQEYDGLKSSADKAKVVSDTSIKAAQKDDGGVLQQMLSSTTAINSMKASLTSSAPLWDVFKTVAAPAVKAANVELTKLITSCPKLAIAMIAVSTAIAAVRSAMNELKKVFATVIDAAKELGSAIGARLKKDITATASALKSLAKSGASLASTGLKNIGKAVLNDVIDPIKSATKTVKYWVSSFGRIALYRTLRSMIKAITDAFKKGTENLYEYSRAMGTAFAPAMDSLATSAQYLSNSLAAMAAPLIQAIAPAIDYIIDKFVALLNIIGKVFAALTGKSVFTQAKKQVVSYGGAAKDSIGGAADKAKELKSYLLGIDELNVIDPNQGAGSGGGGGGAGGLNYGDMFEEVEVPNDLADWAKQVRDAIEAGDWRGVGKLLADKLNEIVTGWDAYGWGQKLGELINRGLNIAFGFLENFDFTNFGRKIASLLNGIFDDLDFDTLGRVLADKWNAMFDFLYGFVTSLHWEQLGHGIAAAINGLVDQIHWEGIGETISAGFKGLFLMLSTAIEEIDWAALGRGLATALNSIDWYGCIMGVGDILKAALEGLRDLLMGFNNTLEWDTIARRIYSGINDGFINRKIDWQGIGNSIGQSFINLFNFLCNVIAGIQWYQLGVNLQTALSGVDWKAAFESFSNLVVESLNGAISALSGFVADTAFWEEFSTALGTGIANLITGIHWGELFANMVTVAVEALRTVITAIAQIASNESFWDELKTGIKTGIQTFIDNRGMWLELFASLPKILAEAISVAVEALGALTADPTFWTELGTSIGAGINQFFLTADLEGLAEGLGKLATDILNGLSAALEKTDWHEAWLKIAYALNEVDWGPLVEAGMRFMVSAMAMKLELMTKKAAIFINIGSNIVGGILQGIVDGIAGIAEWLNTNLVQPIVNGVKNLLGIHSPSTVFAEIGEMLVAGLLEGITGAWDGIINFFSGVLTSLETSISTTWTSIQGTTSTIWGTITGFLKETWENLKTTVTTIFEGIRDKIKEVWDAAKTKTDEIWNAVKKFLIDTWENLKTTVTTVFENIRNKIKEVWDAVKTKTDEIWNAAKKFLTETWENLKTTVTTVFEDIRDKIKEVWDTVERTASELWGRIKTTLSDIWDKIKTTAVETFEGIGTAIKGVWDGLVRDALEWGRDICQGIADGISNGIRIVEGAVSGVARSVRDFIGFSEPEKGPLSDFHTYMPDMLSLMASGIRDNAGTALTAVDDLAAQMSDAFAGISVGEIAAPSTKELSNLLNTDLIEGVQFDIGDTDTVLHEARELADQVSETLSNITCSVEFQSPQNMPTVSDFPDQRMPQVSSQEPQQYSVNRHEDVSVTMQSNNEMVISAILSAAQQIVTAIGESSVDINLDGKTLLRSVEKTGRQRGANIMAGGVRG